jgi:uncharacterized protein YbjT (DUF2867 family)
MENEAVLAMAMDGAHGVFSVQPPSWNPTPETDARELRLGRLAADAALRAGVRHFVYSSVLGAEDAPAYGRTGHKLAIEDHVRGSGLTATVLRPAGFMENFFLPAFGIAQGALNEPTNPDIAVPLIAVDDIGAIAARIFTEPDRYVGATLDLVGDSRTPVEIATVLSRALGRPIAHVHAPLDAVRQVNPLLAALYDWTNEHGYPAVDIHALRRIHPGLKTLKAWLAEGAAERLSTPSEATP